MEKAIDWLLNNADENDQQLINVDLDNSISIKKAIEYMEKFAASKPQIESGDLSEFKFFCQINYPMQSGIICQLIDAFCGKYNM